MRSYKLTHPQKKKKILPELSSNFTNFAHIYPHLGGGHSHPPVSYAYWFRQHFYQQINRLMIIMTKLSTRKISIQGVKEILMSKTISWFEKWWVNRKVSMNSLSNSRFKSNTFIENIIQILSMQKTVFANPHINMKSLNAKTDKRQFQRF